MAKLLKFYLPYLTAFLTAVLILFAQANLELALPDYLSKIVNVGLQQSGIESPLPETIRDSSYQAILAAAPEQHREAIARLYEPSKVDGIHSAQKEAAKLLASDPNLTQAFSSAMLTVLLPDGQELDPSFIEQAAIQAVKLEYAAQGISSESIQASYIINTGGMMLLITLLAALTAIIAGFIASRISAGVARDVRGALFRKVEGFSNSEFDKFSTASLITRSTNDITQVQTITFMIVRMVVYAPIIGIGGVIFAISKAPSMAWIVGLVVILLLGFVILISAIVMPKFKRLQKLVDRLNLVAREQLTGLLVVRAFNRQSFEHERFDEANRNLTSTSLSIARIMVIVPPLIMFIMDVMAIIIIWIAAPKIGAGQIQVGDMMAFIQYSARIIWSFLMLSMVFFVLPRANVSAERIAEVLTTRSSILDPDIPQELPSKVHGRLEFRGLSLRYPGATKPVLQDISFIAEPGEMTAIIGSTGSGKSSIVSLIPRFYDPEEGQILLDGIDIRKLRQKDLRSQIGLVPQKSVLFSGTISENLRFGHELASEDQVKEAAQVAQATSFIEERDKGFDHEISQGGSNVSGGQRQRLAIARALVKKYPVLVFDDSFSALDAKTDAALRRALKEHAADRTLIVVAQKVSTILAADQILVLDEGRILGRGRHEELLKTCPEYQEIVQSQMATGTSI